ncbi:MAG: tetratricopeptide repeat protein [Bacteroidota bacterium]|nr:tetratricopeptide repeat protein [Bacteroidota bacterium]
MLPYKFNIFFQPLRIFLFLLFIHSATGQNSKLDSLEKVLSITKQDTAKVKTLLTLSFELRSTDPDKALKYARQALSLAKINGNKKNEAKALNNIGLAFFYKSENEKAIAYYNNSLSISRALGDSLGIALAYNQIGNVYKGTGNYPLSIEYHKKALGIRMGVKDTTLTSQSYLNLGNAYVKNSQFELALKNFIEGLEMLEYKTGSAEKGAMLNGIGNVYLYQQNYHKAIIHYSEGYKLSVKNNDTRGIGAFSMNLGDCYRFMKNYDSALYFLHKSVDVREKTKNKASTGESYMTLSKAYEEMEKFDKAIEYSKKANDVYEETGIRGALAEARLSLAQLFLKSGNKKVGEKYLKEGLSIADSVKEKQILFSVYQRIAECYNLLGNNITAYEYMAKALEVKDSLYTTNSIGAIAQMQTTFDIKTKESEIESLNKEKVIRNYKIDQQQNIIFILFGSALVFVVLVFFIYRGYKKTKTTNQALSHAYEQINEKNKSISDSILYAKNIQNALLKLPGSFEKLMKQDYFILYKPKDVVSGDFYWIEEYNNLLLVAAADCTGHGVPGSLMSMLGIEKLKQAVREKGLTNPSEILSFVNRSFKETLSASGSEIALRDGMDIALCCIEPERDIIKFAGANRPLWILETSGKEKKLIEIKPTKTAIGGFTEDRQEFAQHEVLVNKGDTVYLFTDGFADQFGGDKNKKFNLKRFRELIPSISHLSMQEQKIELNKAFDEWKGDYEQVDDVLVIGLRNS